MGQAGNIKEATQCFVDGQTVGKQSSHEDGNDDYDDSDDDGDDDGDDDSDDDSDDEKQWLGKPDLQIRR